MARAIVQRSSASSALRRRSAAADKPPNAECRPMQKQCHRPLEPSHRTLEVTASGGVSRERRRSPALRRGVVGKHGLRVDYKGAGPALALLRHVGGAAASGA